MAATVKRQSDISTTSGQMGRTDNNGLATLERIGSPGSIGETENDGLRKSGT